MRTIITAILLAAVLLLPIESAQAATFKVAAKNITQTTAQVKWTKVKKAKGYIVYKDGKTYKTLKSTNCSIKGLKAGSTAKITVKAFKKKKTRKVFIASKTISVKTKAIEKKVDPPVNKVDILIQDDGKPISETFYITLKGKVTYKETVENGKISLNLILGDYDIVIRTDDETGKYCIPEDEVLKVTAGRPVTKILEIDKTPTFFDVVVLKKSDAPISATFRIEDDEGNVIKEQTMVLVKGYNYPMSAELPSGAYTITAIFYEEAPCSHMQDISIDNDNRIQSIGYLESDEGYEEWKGECEQ